MCWQRIGTTIGHSWKSPTAIYCHSDSQHTVVVIVLHYEELFSSSLLQHSTHQIKAFHFQFLKKGESILRDTTYGTCVRRHVLKGHSQEQILLLKRFISPSVTAFLRHNRSSESLNWQLGSIASRLRFAPLHLEEEEEVEKDWATAKGNAAPWGQREWEKVKENVRQWGAPRWKRWCTDGPRHGRQKQNIDSER